MEKTSTTKQAIIIFCLFLLPHLLFSQAHWESIVVESDEWQYLAATSEPNANWYKPGFADSGWSTGIGGFGYDDGDDATVIDAVNSVYIRTKVNIDNLEIIDHLILDIDYDDAFVCYLNGKEVAKSPNIRWTPVSYDSRLRDSHEAQLYQNGDPDRFNLNKNDLVQGENTVAVQILNNGLNSSDLSGRVFLSAKINSANIVFKPTPTWFKEPVSYDEVNLPLVLINTQGKDIPDEPKLSAQMKIINNSNGINNIHDTNYEYNGNIGIETRGNTSQTFFDKKSFALETRTAQDSNLNVSILGMPEENDWVLYGPFSDKSMIRNVLAYNLGNKTGNWSPRTKFCELFINDEYRGIYVFLESIKIDKNRVDIANLQEEDISGDELTGGYILRIDREREGSWVSPYMGRTASSKEPISYMDPKYDELAPEQLKYIQDYVTLFEYTLASDDFKDPEKGYRKFIDVTSFVDLFIMTELARDLDGYRCSVYFHKDKDSNGGKLNMSPLWDFNLCFGNADFMEAFNPEGWVVEGIGKGDGYEPIFWWNRLLQDPYFVNELKNRWSELRNSSFSNESIMGVIDSCANYLSEAQIRNYQKFDILNKTVWPNPYIFGSYEKEVNYLKEWVTLRLAWMDANIPSIKREYMDIVVRPGVDIEALVSKIDIEPTEETPDENTGIATSLQDGQVFLSSYPNPFTDKVTIGFNLNKSAKVECIVYNKLGVHISSKTGYWNPGWHNILLTSQDFKSKAGIYFYSFIVDGELISTGKLVKY